MRIFNTYGPRMAADDGRVVSNFIVQALQDRPITVYGSGDQTRSFCYMEDTVDAMIRLMVTDDSVTGPINVGNPSEFTMMELAQKVLQLTGSDSYIVREELPGDDPKQRRPDISQAKSLLDWSPKMDVDEGLKRTIRYFQNVLRENNTTI